MQFAFSTSRTSAPRIVSWSPPLDGGVKLNSDGNSQGNIGLSGFGETSYKSSKGEIPFNKGVGNQFII